MASSVLGRLKNTRLITKTITVFLLCLIFFAGFSAFQIFVSKAEMPNLVPQTTEPPSTNKSSTSNVDEPLNRLTTTALDSQKSSPPNENLPIFNPLETKPEEGANGQTVRTHAMSTPQVTRDSGFYPLTSSPPAIYDRQMGLTFTQNFNALYYNVTAVQQVDENGYGPGYLLNGVTDQGYWYQAGIAFDWTLVGGGYIPGWGFLYWVFNNNGQPIYGSLSSFTGTINDGDSILLSLTFSSGNVVMSASDWNTGANAQKTYSAMSASIFQGQPNSFSDSRGFFTGLMTEWWRANPYYGNEQQVMYSNTISALSSGWQWADEYVPSNGTSQFNEALKFYFLNPVQLQYYPLHVCTCVLAANGNSFITGAVWTTKTWTVDKEGSADFSTIQDAINAAAPGDTILVRPGTYNEHLDIYKAANLYGQDKERTIIDGSLSGDIVKIRAPNVTLNGFTLQRSGTVFNSGVTVTSYYAGASRGYSFGTNISNNIISSNPYGISLNDNSNKSIIYGNDIKNSSYYGIYFSFSSKNNLTANNLTNNFYSVSLSYSTNNNIAQNKLVNSTQYGITLSSSSDNNTITQNSISNSNYGIRLSSLNNTVSLNDLTSSLSGITVSSLADNNLITSNNVTNNQLYGISITSSNNTLSFNNITNSNSGIYISTPNNRVTSNNITINTSYGIGSFSNLNSISLNNITTSYNGIYLSSSSNGNVFNNSIANSTSDAIVILSSLNNTITSNRIANNKGSGIFLTSSNNSIALNNITSNSFYGISLSTATNNSVIANDITGNTIAGINLIASQANIIFHNNLIGNPTPAQVSPIGYANVWDNGYPSGGNYWSNYNGIDANHDGIGDTPYTIDPSNIDNYPLMTPHSTQPTITLTGVTLISGGKSYTTPHILLTGGGGTGATATAHVSCGLIYSIIITNPGSGYISAPTVTVRDPSPRATGSEAIVNYQVNYP